MGGREGRTVGGSHRVGCTAQVWWKEAWAGSAEVGRFMLLHCKEVFSTHTLGSWNGPEWGEEKLENIAELEGLFVFPPSVTCERDNPSSHKKRSTQSPSHFQYTALSVVTAVSGLSHSLTVVESSSPVRRNTVCESRTNYSIPAPPWSSATRRRILGR